jgi:hypothetical protein
LKSELTEIQNNSAKWKAAFEKERERQRLKSKRQREAKKAAKAAYTIEGKSIEQLVKENLGIEVETRLGTGFICGYSTIIKDTITVGLNNDEGWLATNEKIYSKYKSYWNLCEEDDYNNAIEAIKKHRNML